MFKNRVRTAALAGAIAVATGVSGLAVPAYAQTQQDGTNISDGSAALNVSPENITEEQLRDATDLTATYLETFQQGGDLKQIVDEYIDLGQDGSDTSEEAAQQAFDRARQNASTQLAAAGENIQDARASVAFALDADEQAEADWDALVNALDAAGLAINDDVERTNEVNTHTTDFPLLDTLVDADRDNAVEVYNALLALQTEVDRQFDLAGVWNIDREDGEYVNRDHLKALEALKNEVDAQVEAATPAYETAIASNREAQKSDVLVRQLYLERATAQRDSLRAVEAYFSVIARYVELYQNNELVGDSTLRTEYREVLDNIEAGIAYNLENLQVADDATDEYHNGWESDLTNNDDDSQYWGDKLDLAVATYQNIFENGRIWQEALERVELIDAGIITDREQLEQDRKDEQQWRDDIRDAWEDYLENRENDENETPGDIEEPGMSSGSSEKGGLIGLVAAIGGVVALIAAAFPFISNFMR